MRNCLIRYFAFTLDFWMTGLGRILRATLDPGLNRLVLSEDLGKLRCCRDALQVLDRGRRSLPHLGIQKEAARKEQRGRHHQVSQRQLLTDQVLLAALDGSLDLVQRALERRGGEAVQRLVVGPELEHHDQSRREMGDELRVGEERPLGDLGLGLGVRAEELLGPGPAAGQVCGDRRALGQGETIGALEGWDLSERELGKELWCLVCLAELELGNVDLEAVECGNDLSLQHVRGMSLARTVLIVQHVLCRDLHAAPESCSGTSKLCRRNFWSPC